MPLIFIFVFPVWWWKVPSLFSFSDYNSLGLCMHCMRCIYVQYISGWIHKVFSISCNRSDVLLLDARWALLCWHWFAGNFVMNCSPWLFCFQYYSFANDEWTVWSGPVKYSAPIIPCGWPFKSVLKQDASVCVWRFFLKLWRATRRKPTTNVAVLICWNNPSGVLQRQLRTRRSTAVIERHILKL